MNNLAEKEMPQDNWFAETKMLVAFGKARKEVLCRATHFSVTENTSTYQIEIYGIQIEGLTREDYEKIPVNSQNLIKERLIQTLTEKLELIRKPRKPTSMPPPTPIMPSVA